MVNLPFAVNTLSSSTAPVATPLITGASFVPATVTFIVWVIVSVPETPVTVKISCAVSEAPNIWAAALSSVYFQLPNASIAKLP